MNYNHDLKATVRTILDYPKLAILFRDITTLLADARAFRRAVDELVQPWAGNKIDKVAGIEARGFILGGAVAHQVSAGFVPIRKKGKLPHTTVRIAYSLEYGLDEMEMHADAVHPGERVILVDDLIATGAPRRAPSNFCARSAPRWWPPVLSSTYLISVGRRNCGRWTCRCER
jgi:adenine phosphoribosyltransferase